MPYNFKPPDIFEAISSPHVMMASVVQDVEQPAYKSIGSWFDLRLLLWVDGLRVTFGTVTH